MSKEGKLFKDQILELMETARVLKDKGYRYAAVIMPLRNIMDNIGFYDMNEMDPDRIYWDSAIRELTRVEALLDDTDPSERKMLGEIGKIRAYILNRMWEEENA